MILGTGGYVCWPVIRAGQSLDIPTALHESNITPGLTTKLLAKRCVKVLLNHTETKQYLKNEANIAVVGNPLRIGFKKIKKDEKFKVFTRL